MKPILEEFLILKGKFNTIRTTICNNTNYENEYFNSYNVIINLENKIKSQIIQLIPELNLRKKRGLINGLGSIVKCLTGNLDQEDAEKFNAQIKNLQGNQESLKNIISDQVSLMNISIKNFNEITMNISHNQLILDSRIKQIENFIRKTKLTEINNYQYFLTYTVLNQITFTFQIMYDILERIETAISFAKLNTLHNSIINPVVFSQEIKTIENFIKPFNLPFENKLENMLKLEKLIEIKSFQQGTEITFILELPLVEITNYQYYELLPFPVKINDSYVTIIPKTKFLAISDVSFLEANEKCIEFSNKEFICKNVIKNIIENNVNCELEIIKYSKVIPACNTNQFNLNSPLVYKINTANYIAIIPKALLITETCKEMKNNKNLQPGSYLISIDVDCYIQIKNYKLITRKALPILPSNIEIPNININLNLTHKEINFNDINLKQINTDKLRNLEVLLDIQKSKLDDIKVQTITGNISIGTIILYLVLGIVIIYYFVRKIVNPVITKYKRNKQNNLKQSNIEIKI